MVFPLEIKKMSENTPPPHGDAETETLKNSQRELML
jgi:hypothetical protein